MGQFLSLSEFPLPASSQFSLHTENKPIIEKTREMEKLKKKTAPFSFWNWVIASIIFRLILIYFPKNLNLFSRPGVSTPLTSFRRLAEGYWLKQSSMSPYAGSMYHGSPLLLSLFGPLTVKRIEGQPNHLLYNLVSVIADVVNAMLIRATGKNLRLAYLRSLESLDPVKQKGVSGLVPLAVFGWVIATHLSLYPAILIIPGAVQMLLLGNCFCKGTKKKKC